MKDIYEEALSDVKKLTKVAEDNAKLAVIEACTPRIREFIESQLMGHDIDGEDDASMDVDITVDDNGEEDDFVAPGMPDVGGDLLADNEVASSEDEQAAAVTLPDEDGKVTLDVDAVASPGAGTEEYEVTFENLEKLAPIARAAKKTVLGKNITSIAEGVSALKSASRILRATSAYKLQVENALSRIENIYSHVQENVKDPAEKLVHENRLEAIFKDLNELQEQKMSTKKQKKRLTEEDVTLTLTGLPDDIDLDSIGVDLVSGEDEVDDVGGADEAGDQGGDDQGEVDFDALGGDDQGGQDQEMEEGDEMIEIDEALLRREITRMRKLRESEQHKQGRADDSDVIHDFGGGCDDGDPWEDHDVNTRVDESEDAMDEAEECNEDDEVQMEAKRPAKKVSRGLKETSLRAASKSAPVRRSAENKTEAALREKLAETNLFNAKLMYTNKLLQTETLTKRQKAHIIERLDEAKSISDVKLVYNSLVKTLSTSTQTVKEGAERRVLGSSSRTTTSSSTLVNEGFETSRWARLAGISKK